MSFEKHLINQDELIKVALAKLDQLAADAVLFVVDKDLKLLGSLTDGDVRRGFLKGHTLENAVRDFIQPSPKYIFMNRVSIDELIVLRKRDFKIIPVLDDDHRVRDIINFRLLKSYLPIDVVIMAGGRGERLKPMTDNLPKPLLMVGEKTIIEHNLDRLSAFGVRNFTISVRYLGEKIKTHLGNGSSRNISINYIEETEPLGTIGAVAQMNKPLSSFVLLTNSDLLTNIDYEDFFLDFIKREAHCSIVTIPYHVDVPYAVLETNDGHIVSLKEKPTYTYYSNGGIYLFRKECFDLIPRNAFYNATDLLEKLIANNKKVISYPMRGYWLDIGRHEDFTKANTDINHVKF